MAEQVFKKDTAWGDSKNFIGESEITVTITLAEYRELVKADGVWDKKYGDRLREISELQQKNSALEAKVKTYKDMLCIKETE